MLEKIQLNVRASNFAAMSLYKKMGFEEEGRLKNRIKLQDRYIDDILMGLDLKKNEVDQINVSQKAVNKFTTINILPAEPFELANLDKAITEYNVLAASECRWLNFIDWIFQPNIKMDNC